MNHTSFHECLKCSLYFHLHINLSSHVHCKFHKSLMIYVFMLKGFFLYYFAKAASLPNCFVKQSAHAKTKEG